MKYELIIDPSKEESLILTVHERNDFVNAIEELLLDKNAITAYRNDEAVKIPINEISCLKKWQKLVMQQLWKVRIRRC